MQHLSSMPNPSYMHTQYVKCHSHIDSQVQVKKFMPKSYTNARKMACVHSYLEWSIAFYNSVKIGWDFGPACRIVEQKVVSSW
jgi:hypothetical protein